MYVIIWRYGYKNSHIDRDSQGFINEFSDYDYAKQVAEDGKGEYPFDSYQIFELKDIKN